MIASQVFLAIRKKNLRFLKKVAEIFDKIYVIAGENGVAIVDFVSCLPTEPNRGVRKKMYLCAD